MKVKCENCKHYFHHKKVKLEHRKKPVEVFWCFSNPTHTELKDVVGYKSTLANPEEKNANGDCVEFENKGE